MLPYSFHKTVSAFRVTALANLSYYRIPEDFDYMQEESHDFWELTYVDKGQIAVYHSGNAFLLKAGEMMLCKPNIVHRSHAYQNDFSCVVDIEFVLDCPLPEEFDNEIIILNAEQRQCMAAIIREASQTYDHFEKAPNTEVQMKLTDSVPYGSQQIICNRLEELLIYACRGNRSIRIDRRLIPTDLQTNLAAQIQAYIGEHLNEKLTLQTVAKNHCISVTKLKRLFREDVGRSVVTYLTEQRIKEAKNLIRQGQLNFSQIAEAVGFESIHYFSAVFKKQTGMSPTEYARSKK